MVKKIIQTLVSPYPYTRGFIAEMKTICIICILVIGTVFISSPSLFELLSQNELVGFFIISLLGIFFNLFCSLILFRNLIEEKKWKVWKEVLKSIFYLSIITVSLLYYVSIVSIHIQFKTVLQYGYYAFLFSIIPISLRINAINLWLLKKQLAETQKFNSIIESGKKKRYNRTIRIKSNLINEKIETSEEELLFIKADQNYIEVTIEKEQKLKKKLLRISLVKAIEQIKSEQIVRCHRSYVVNLMHIKKTKGNSQGLKLMMNHCDEGIPVSRKYKDDLVKKLSRFNE
jgi:glucan phosphoethanolaminetransferase (alkaline phosphatase superfamily)